MTDENQTQELGSKLPPLTFDVLITEYATTAMAYLGGMEDPETKKPVFNLPFAKRMIDTIDLLKEKTEGNLSAPESNFLENTLYSLKMAYVRSVNMQQRSTDPKSSEEE